MRADSVSGQTARLEERKPHAHPLLERLRPEVRRRVAGLLTEIVGCTEARILTQGDRVFLNVKDFPNLPLVGWPVDTPEKKELFVRNLALSITPVEEVGAAERTRILLVPPAWGRAGIFSPFEFSDKEGRHFFDLVLKGIGETKLVRGTQVGKDMQVWAQKRGLVVGQERAGDAVRDWENFERLNRLGVRVPLGVAIFNLDSRDSLENEDQRRVLYLRAFREALRCSDFFYVPRWQRMVLEYVGSKISRYEAPEVKGARTYLDFFTTQLGTQAALMENAGYIHNNLLWWGSDDPECRRDRVQGNNVTLAAEVVDFDTGRFAEASEFEDPETRRRGFEKFFTQYYALAANAIFLGRISTGLAPEGLTPDEVQQRIERVFFTAFRSRLKKEDVEPLQDVFLTHGPKVEVRTQDDAHGVIRIGQTVELWRNLQV